MPLEKMGLYHFWRTFSLVVINTVFLNNEYARYQHNSSLIQHHLNSLPENSRLFIFLLFHLPREGSFRGPCHI